MADATLLKYLGLAVYCSPHARHGFQPEAPHDSARPHRDGGRLAPASPATSQDVSPRRESPPQSPPRWSPAAAHWHGTPAPRCAGLPARAQAPAVYLVWLKYYVASRGLAMRVAEQSTKAFSPQHVPRV